MRNFEERSDKLRRHVGDNSAASKSTAISNADNSTFHATRLDSDERNDRVYLKSAISGHKLWSSDDFWDQALYQCVAEALHHSHVLPTLYEQVRNGDCCQLLCRF